MCRALLFECFLESRIFFFNQKMQQFGKNKNILIFHTLFFCLKRVKCTNKDDFMFLTGLLLIMIIRLICFMLFGGSVLCKLLFSGAG